MDLNEWAGTWQQQQIPQQLDGAMLKQMATFNDNLKKENTRLSYWLAGTIYITGFSVLPLLKDERLMFIIMGIWFLIGFQAIIFWMRQSSISKSIEEDPARFVKARIAKLRYNLLVTNLFVPLYVVLLGILSSYYLYFILEGVEMNLLMAIIAGTWTFYAVVFLVSWRKQRKKDANLIIPQLKNLRKIQMDYESGQ